MSQAGQQSDDDDARERIREWRRSRRIAVLDDDPTGSQSVHQVEVVTVRDVGELQATLKEPGSVGFVLTNTRALPEGEAVLLNTDVASQLMALYPDVDIVSRGDSTLRGHVLSEVRAINRVRTEATGSGYDGVILAPAFFEAGRFTSNDVHFATVGGQPVPVGETEFARDATFGYTSSGLRDFVVEKSNGDIGADQVLSISLSTIRFGGPDGVRDVLLSARDMQFIVVNGTSYADYETVVLGVQAAIDAGRSFLFRTGPSFVRALAGIEPRSPLGADDFAHLNGVKGHGLVVVGSHVSQTSRQIEAARERADLLEVEVDVTRVLASDEKYLRDRTEAVRRGLVESDVILFTSRQLVSGDDAGSSLDIARAVSAAISSIVSGAVSAVPAWVVVKGGITSHDVAVRGLGIRRAIVLGQLLPGQISVLDPVSAPQHVVGMPYVVFAGNVGDDNTLARVIETLHSAQAAA